MGFGIAAFGLDAVRASLALLQEEMNVRINDAIQLAAIHCDEDAQLLSPVDTGEMRDGFYSVELGPMKSATANDVEHSLYVELGTYKMAAQPTLFPAFVWASNELVDTLRSL